jgi:hypothetical protein
VRFGSQLKASEMSSLSRGVVEQQRGTELLVDSCERNDAECSIFPPALGTLLFVPPRSSAASDVVTRMLHFNQGGEDKRESAGWKLLVYDQFGRDVLAPLLNVAELRRLGITLHLCVCIPVPRVHHRACVSARACPPSALYPCRVFISCTRIVLNMFSTFILPALACHSYHLSLTGSLSARYFCFVYCRWGVSLIDKSRDQVGDVPAIYFVAPTEENLSRIAHVRSKFLAGHLGAFLPLARPVHSQ